MADHWYLCVACKTPGCQAVRTVRYLGAFDPAHEAPFFEIDWVPREIECESCGKTHFYHLQNTQCRKLPFPPAGGES